MKSSAAHHPMTVNRTAQADARSDTRDASTEQHGSALSLDATSPGGAAGLALGLAAIIVVAEYLARRLLAPALPTLGSPVVNDMLAMTLCYLLLVLLTAPPGARSPAALGRALRGVAASARSWLPWIGGVAFLLAVLVLAPVDALLWGTVRLPSFAVPASETVLFAGAAVPLAAISLLLVNGVVVPLAEERLWRGLIQPRLRVAWGLASGLLVTAVLFSLKHAIVDASLGRLLAITAGGLVLGGVAFRAGGAEGGRTGWRASGVSHMVGNLMATSLALAAGAV
jgi:membrane protease YdiL (CAAX protease family)